MGKKVISYSLYGDDPLYTEGALRNQALLQTVYPGWVSRFYVAHDVPTPVVRQLERRGAEVVQMTRRDATDGMFWRFLSAADCDVDAVIFRDADSRIGGRERAAVDAWLAGGKSFHIMRDHPCHAALILGGMWGCRSGVLSDMAALIAQWKVYDQKGADQQFLAEVVYPRVRGDCLIHSDLVSFEGETTTPFPVPRVGAEFVGSVCEPDSDEGSAAARREGLACFRHAQHTKYPMPVHRRRFKARVKRALRAWTQFFAGSAGAGSEGTLHG